MMDGPQITVSLALHKIIEKARVSFDETPDEILLRLLERQIESSQNAESGESWSGQGVTLPHGTKLKMTYNGVTYEGVLANGAWHVKGKVFHSPSGAARGVAQTKKGKPVSLDGWKYWYVQVPGADEFEKISSLLKGK